MQVDEFPSRVAEIMRAINIFIREEAPVTPGFAPRELGVYYSNEKSRLYIIAKYSGASTFTQEITATTDQLAQFLCMYEQVGSILMKYVVYSFGGMWYMCREGEVLEKCYELFCNTTQFLFGNSRWERKAATLLTKWRYQR